MFLAWTFELRCDIPTRGVFVRGAAPLFSIPCVTSQAEGMDEEGPGTEYDEITILKAAVFS